MIPADCILVDDSEVLCSESNLTGESSEVLKSRSGDCFLLSSCIITGLPKTVHAGRCTGLAIAVGMQSQWGKIKASLMTETVNTPLQDKLQDMTAKVRNYIKPLSILRI
jgi:magnesium-transporting ATPase (P-type)